MMNIDNLTISEAREIAALFTGKITIKNASGMIGKYVIVRCRDAGIHAGILISHQNRECLLHEARRLWYWEVRNNASCNLSGVATEGVSSNSKIGAQVNIYLTENCEIIECTKAAEKSIREQPNHAE